MRWLAFSYRSRVVRRKRSDDALVCDTVIAVRVCVLFEVMVMVLDKIKTGIALETGAVVVAVEVRGMVWAAIPVENVKTSIRPFWIVW